MLKKKYTILVSSFITVLLEALPIAGSYHIPSADGAHAARSCSYFSILPFSDTNFAPFAVAVLSCVLLVLSAVYYFYDNKYMNKSIFVVSCLAMVTSFIPFFYCLDCLSFAGCGISLLLFIVCINTAEQ